MGMPELYKSSFDLEEFERFSLAKTLKKKKKKEEIETEEESEEETEEESESETETESESEDEYQEIADLMLLEYVRQLPLGDINLRWDII